MKFEFRTNENNKNIWPVVVSMAGRPRIRACAHGRYLISAVMGRAWRDGARGPSMALKW